MEEFLYKTTGLGQRSFIPKSVEVVTFPAMSPNVTISWSYSEVVSAGKATTHADEIRHVLSGASKRHNASTFGVSGRREDDISGATVSEESAHTPTRWLRDGNGVRQPEAPTETAAEYPLHPHESRELLDLVRQDEVVVLIVFVSIAISVALLMLLISKVMWRRKQGQYQRLPTSDPSHRYSYIYRPMQGNAALDDEYENTFVGVSIPLLQDNTRI